MHGRLISYINIYHLCTGFQYTISFSLQFCRPAGVMSLEVKYDRFGNGEKGTWQRPIAILTTKDRWSEHLRYVTDVLQSEKASRWKSINAHTEHCFKFELSDIIPTDAHDISTLLFCIFSFVLNKPWRRTKVWTNLGGEITLYKVLWRFWLFFKK